jgi:hypothetical protein
MPRDPVRVAEARGWLLKEPTIDESDTAVALAKSVYEAIVARVPDEVRP